MTKYILPILAILCLFSCEKDPGIILNAPKIKLLEHTDLRRTTVILNGELDASALSSIKEIGFLISEDATLGEDATKYTIEMADSTSLSNTEYNVMVRDLKIESPYFYAMYVTNGITTLKTEAKAVVTLRNSPPSVGPCQAELSKVGYFFAELYDDGGSPVQQYSFCWADHDDPTIYDNHIKKADKIEGEIFSTTFPEMVKGVTYYVRAIADNKEGISYGPVLKYQVAEDAKPAIPSLKMTLLEHSDLRRTTVILNGMIDELEVNDVEEIGFLIGKDASLGEDAIKYTIDLGELTSISNSKYSIMLKDLDIEAPYFYAMYAIKGATIVKTDVKSVTTLISSVPSVGYCQTDITKVGYFFAELHDDGGSPVEQYSFCWADHEEPTIADNNVQTTNKIVNKIFSTTFPEMVKGVVYYVRAVAESKEGISYGPVLKYQVAEDAKPDYPVNPSEMFPDRVFRNYVLASFDTNGDGTISKDEAGAVTEISISKDADAPITTDSIASLQGLEYFINLGNLTCEGTYTWYAGQGYPNGKVATLDLSNNIRLTKLQCAGNSLTQLDISKNTALMSIDCGVNYLTQLDVSSNTKLTKLDCHYNLLTQLDVSKNIKLERLSCFYNDLTKLDISNNTELTTLRCLACDLTQLDLSKNTKLTWLECGSNNLTFLDVSKNTKLYYFWCNNNQLTKVDVSKNTTLSELFCHNNALTQLDVGQNAKLTWLTCDNNRFTELDISLNTALADFNCTSNPDLATIWVWKGFDKASDPDFEKDSYSEYKVFGEVATITAEAVAGGETISLDLGSVVDLSDFAWDIAGITVSHRTGTTYDFVVPANQSDGITASSWKKLVVNETSIDEISSSESDPDAHPTVFGVGASARQFIGTIDGVLKVEITQKAGSAVEYLGRYGSPLTSSEKALAENAGHTRKRALISTSDAPNLMEWGGYGVTTNITNKWDGLANTASLVALGSEYEAASYCASLGKGWYLPAQNQLAGAWVVHSGLTAFMFSFYWSSTEINSNYSWSVHFGYGYVYNYYYKSVDFRVRCIRDL